MSDQFSLNDILYSCKRNRYAYAFLAILFGTFGIHQFYVGHNFFGCLCLLFFWTGIPTVVGIFQGLGALFLPKPSDGRGNIYFI